MPIPDFSADGLLPPGIHDCTLQEIRHRFGSFQGTEQRLRLFAKLEQLLEAMKQSGIFAAILIDGSFVTTKTVPNDVDLTASTNMTSTKEAILDQTVEQLELMSKALASLRREHLPSQPRTFAILAQGPLEEIRRL